MTVGRLRRLLQYDDAIVLNEGRLQLSPAHVWTDVAPLRRALTYARFQRDEQISRKPADDAGASIGAVPEHYAGPFMADEEGPPLVISRKGSTHGGRAASFDVGRQIIRRQRR